MARKKNVIAPNNEKSLVAMEKMSVDVLKARELYGDGEPFEEERVLDCIVFRYKRAGYEIVAMGKYCKWLKAEIGHGRFLEGLSRRNIAERDAQWAMLIVEKFGPNTSTLSDLGISKARYLTAFTEKEIDTYAKGGPIGDIPHDDVANMTARELESEVRRLRTQLKRTEDVAKEKIRQRDDQITKLEFENENQAPFTKEHLAVLALKKYRDPIIDNILAATERINRATAAIDEAQKIPHVPFDELEKLIEPWNGSFEAFIDAAEDFSDAFKNIHVDKGRE
jgi:hypothetical protein